MPSGCVYTHFYRYVSPCYDEMAAVGFPVLSASNIIWCAFSPMGMLYSYSAWASALLDLDGMGNARRLEEREEQQVQTPALFFLCQQKTNL